MSAAESKPSSDRFVLPAADRARLVELMLDAPPEALVAAVEKIVAREVAKAQR